MRPQDLARLRTLGAPHFHPDGRRIAFTVSRPNLDDDRYDRAVWLWDGEQARPFTAGPGDASPRWSPEGGRLAFLRKVDEHAQVAVMPADGGEARIVSDFPLGASALEWSPDGRRLVAVGAEWIAALADLDDDERARRPRRVTRLPYRFDDEGWLSDRRTHLWLVDPDGADEARCLTPGEDFDEHGPAWRPDGSAVAFLSGRHDRREHDGAEQPFEVDVDTGEVRALADPGQWEWVGYDPAGVAHVGGTAEPLGWPDLGRYYRIGTEGLEDRTGHLDRTAVMPGDAAGPGFADGALVCTIEDRGRERLVRIDPDGRHTTLVGGDRVVTAFALAPGGHRVAFVSTTSDDPGELRLLDADGERTLTGCNAEIREAGVLRPGRHTTFDRDGQELDLWLLEPDGDGPSPLLLNIHGGPTAQYGFGFFDEFQVYAAAGYTVAATNPRGSSGRGRDFMRAVVGAWTELDSVDMLDLRAAVDAATAASDRVDPERLGIMGGSYGGYATARILVAEDRFRSAVVERGLLAWESFSGTSDIGAYFDRMFLGASLPDGVDAHRAASPVPLAHRIDTPTLVLHAEHDWRCPIEQAEQLFSALRLSGTPTELLRFPDEGHELSRSGAPRHRVERFEAILDWHERHL